MTRRSAIRDVAIAICSSVALSLVLLVVFKGSYLSRPQKVLIDEGPAAIAVAVLLMKWAWWKRAGWQVPVWRSLWLLWLPLLLAYAAMSGRPLVEGDISHMAITVASVMVIGFTEEMWFRGLVLASLLPKSPRIAVIGSSLGFAAAHMANAPGLGPRSASLIALNAFGAGMMFGAARLRIRSVVPLILVHAAVDYQYVLHSRVLFSTTPNGRSLMLVLVPSLIYAAVLTRKSRVQATAP